MCRVSCGRWAVFLGTLEQRNLGMRTVPNAYELERAAGAFTSCESWYGYAMQEGRVEAAPYKREAKMKKTHSEKTDSFMARDKDSNEYLVHEFTQFDDITSPDQPPQKVSVVRYYKTDKGEQVQKKTNTDFVILTGYGFKNIEVRAVGKPESKKAPKK